MYRYAYLTFLLYVYQQVNLVITSPRGKKILQYFQKVAPFLMLALNPSSHPDSILCLNQKCTLSGNPFNEREGCRFINFEDEFVVTRASFRAYFKSGKTSPVRYEIGVILAPDHHRRGMLDESCDSWDTGMSLHINTE